MGDVTNRIIDELVTKGYDKATRDAERYASAQDKVARAQRVMRQSTGTDASWRSRFADWDAERRITRDNIRTMRNLQAQEKQRLLDRTQIIQQDKKTTSRRSSGREFAQQFGARTRVPGLSGVLGGAGVGGALGLVAGAAVYGLTRFTASSIAAAGATDKWRHKYNAASTGFDNAVQQLNETIGNQLMPSFLGLAQRARDAAGTLAHALDSKLIERIQRENAVPFGKAYERQELEKLRKETGGKGFGGPHQRLGHVTNRPGISISEDFEGSRDLQEKRRRAIEEERRFRHRLFKEQIEEMHKGRAPSMRDLARYVVGGGSQAGIGVTPVELRNGQAGGRRNDTIRVRIDGRESTDPLWTAFGRFFEMAINQGIRQGVLAPGPGR